MSHAAFHAETQTSTGESVGANVDPRKQAWWYDQSKLIVFIAAVLRASS